MSKIGLGRKRGKDKAVTLAIGEAELSPSSGEVVEAQPEVPAEAEAAAGDELVSTPDHDREEVAEAVEEAVVVETPRPISTPPASLISDEGQAPAGRSKRFFGRGLKAADPEADQKVRKGRVRNGKAAGDADPLEEMPLPTNLAVDFYRGVTKVREAEQIARAFVEKHFEAPNASWVYVQQWRDGCAVEMQEGGGKAYLPQVLAKIDADEDSLCILPMSGRVMQVRLDRDTKTLEALLLTAGQLPPEDAFIALPTKVMVPIDKRGSKVFIAGVGLLAASMIALVFSVGAFFIDTHAWSLPYIQQTPAKDLPSAQVQRLNSVLQQGDCVAKMEYLNGNWQILPGWDDGSGVCSSTRPATPAEPTVAEGTAVVTDENAGPPPVGVVPGSVPPPPPVSATPVTAN